MFRRKPEASAPELVQNSAQDLAWRASSFERFRLCSKLFFSENRKLSSITRDVQALGSHMEPVDSVLGTDSKRHRETGFRNGVVAGFIIGEPLLPRKLGGLAAISGRVTKEVSDLYVADDPVDAAEQKASYLDNLGWQGLQAYPEIEDDVDSIADVLHPDMYTQTAVRAGTGVALWMCNETYLGIQMNDMVRDIHRGRVDLDQLLTRLLDEAPGD